MEIPPEANHAIRLSFVLKEARDDNMVILNGFRMLHHLAVSLANLNASNIHSTMPFGVMLLLF